jgi:hypothetical protein
MTTSSQSSVRPPIRKTDQALRRRGLLAAAWAGVAAFVVGKMTQVVQATAFPVQYSDTPSQQFQYFVSSPVFLGGQTNLPTSVWGNVVLDLRGYDPGSDGLHVTSYQATGIRSTSLAAGNAVLGQVGGSSNAIAIYGQNYSTYAGATPGAGGFGVYGLSAKGHGLVGATATAGGAAVVGASNGVAGAYAGAFYGSVVVSGSFTVFGAKSAAVPHPDGSHRRLYCMESPESWFEDFGTGQLECGRAEVAIDPDFAAIVDLADYHVFLTEYDTDAMLHVRHRTNAGFAVEADPDIATLKGKEDTDLNGTFSWRVVAKRKDINAERLATVRIPPEPVLPPVPGVPAAPPPSRTTRASSNIPTPWPSRSGASAGG